MFNWTLTKFTLVETKTREALFKTLRFHAQPPKPRLPKLAADHKDTTTAHLYAEATDANGSYYKDNAAKTDQGATPRNKDEDALTSRLFTIFHEYLETGPFPAEHTVMLNEILAALNDSHVTLEEHLNFPDFKNKICEAIETYLDFTVKWFFDQKFTNEQDFQARKHHRQIWHSNAGPTTPYLNADGTTFAGASEHQDMVTSIAKAMTHNQVPDDFVVFLLSLSLSSAGYVFLEDVDYPTYLNFMPPNWVANNRDEIWSLRMQNKFEDEEQFYDPSDIDDQNLAHYEQNEFTDLENLKLDGQTQTKPDPNASGRPPMDEDPEHSQRRKSKKDKKGKKPKTPKDEEADEEDSTDQTQGQQSRQQQPQIPDDSGYTPDPIMVYKERDFIKMIQALPTMDMSRDHMTRFNTTSEQAISMPLSQRVKNDKIALFGRFPPYQKFLITFTRKGRKPIFNPVN